MKIRKLLFCTFLTLLWTHCGGNNLKTTYTAQDLFPVAVGKTWHMLNKFGDQTTWTMEAVPSGSSCEADSQPEIALRIQKDATRTCWGLGIPEASDEWVLHQDADGSWRSVQDTPDLPQSCAGATVLLSSPFSGGRCLVCPWSTL